MKEMAKESENQNLDQRIELPGSKTWKKKRKIFLLKVLAAVILIICVTILFPKILKKEDGKVTTITQSSLEKVIEVNDLSTLDYTYNAITDVYDEDGETLKYHVAYEGIVTAGIDITKINVTVNEEEKKISITLPNAVIQNVNVDMGTLAFIFEKNKYETETVSQEAYKASLEDLKKKANKESTLLTMAKDNAAAAMNALIAPWVEQIDDDYTVEVK